MKRIDAKPDISVKNPNYISKERYYELKHFCLQYEEWKKSYISISFYNSSSIVRTNGRFRQLPDSISDIVEARLYFKERMELVESAASRTDDVLARYILKAVTQNLSYDCLNAREYIPCCRETWYELYRKFFYLLSQTRK